MSAVLAPWQPRLILLRKVLGEPKHDAMTLAHAFRHVPLTREKCEAVAIGWHDG